MSISESVNSIKATKQKLKNKLYNTGYDSSATNNFDALVEMGFRDAPDFDAEWLAVKDLRTWTPEGGIGMIISDFGDGWTSFIVDSSGQPYTVVVNDGTSDISTTQYASGATCDIDLGDGTGSTLRAVKITSAGAITRFRVVRTANLSTSTQAIPIEWWYGNLSTLTSMDSMFYSGTNVRCILKRFDITDMGNVTNMSNTFTYCYCLRSMPAVMNTSKVTTMYRTWGYCYSLRNMPSVLNTSKVTTMYLTWVDCRSLRSIPAVLDTSKVNNMYQTWNGCYSLRSLPAVLDTSQVTTMYLTWNSCYSLRSLPEVLDVSKVTSAENITTNNLNLQRELLDFSAATLLTKLSMDTAPGIKRVLVSSVAPFSGTSPQIQIINGGLSRTALVELFMSLPTVTGKTIDIKRNPGTASLDAADIAIATSKGWTVTTV